MCAAWTAGSLWSVAMPALLLERRGPAGALGRSWSLVGGFWWKCFGTLLIAYLLVIVLSVAVGAVVGGVLAAFTSADSLLGLVVTQALDVAVQVFTLPLFAAVTIVFCIGLATRREETPWVKALAAGAVPLATA